MAGFNECSSLSMIQREREETSNNGCLGTHTYNIWTSSKGHTLPVEELQLYNGTHAAHSDKNTWQVRKSQREAAVPSIWPLAARQYAWVPGNINYAYLLLDGGQEKTDAWTFLLSFKRTILEDWMFYSSCIVQPAHTVQYWR
jgi:hypothetical protein